jgi:NADH:ubiquinone oxidoreductase subunit 3 (subunit A)
MLDVGIFFLIQNIFLLTLLFWLLSFLGTKFFKKKNYRASTEIFECGFLSTHSLNLSFNYNFLITATLLILYDVEFFFLLPVLFNYNLINLVSLITFLFFIVAIVVSFVYDWEMVTLDWSV